MYVNQTLLITVSACSGITDRPSQASIRIGSLSSAVQRGVPKSSGCSELPFSLSYHEEEQEFYAELACTRNSEVKPPRPFICLPTPIHSRTKVLNSSDQDKVISPGKHICEKKTALKLKQELHPDFVYFEANVCQSYELNEALEVLDMLHSSQSMNASKRVQTFTEDITDSNCEKKYVEECLQGTDLYHTSNVVHKRNNVLNSLVMNDEDNIEENKMINRNTLQLVSIIPGYDEVNQSKGENIANQDTDISKQDFNMLQKKDSLRKNNSGCYKLKTKQLLNDILFMPGKSQERRIKQEILCEDDLHPIVGSVYVNKETLIEDNNDSSLVCHKNKIAYKQENEDILHYIGNKNNVNQIVNEEGNDLVDVHVFQNDVDKDLQWGKDVREVLNKLLNEVETSGVPSSPERLVSGPLDVTRGNAVSVIPELDSVEKEVNNLTWECHKSSCDFKTPVEKFIITSPDVISKETSSKMAKASTPHETCAAILSPSYSPDQSVISSNEVCHSPELFDNMQDEGNENNVRDRCNRSMINSGVISRSCNSAENISSQTNSNICTGTNNIIPPFEYPENISVDIVSVLSKPQALMIPFKLPSSRRIKFSPPCKKKIPICSMLILPSSSSSMIRSDKCNKDQSIASTDLTHVLTTTSLYDQRSSRAIVDPMSSIVNVEPCPKDFALNMNIATSPFALVEMQYLQSSTLELSHKARSVQTSPMLKLETKNAQTSPLMASITYKVGDSTESCIHCCKQVHTTTTAVQTSPNIINNRRSTRQKKKFKLLLEP